MDKVKLISALFIGGDEAEFAAIEEMIGRKKLFDTSTVVCYSIKAAESILSGAVYDVIVSDYNLVDGIGTSIIPKANGKPVIIVAGQGQEDVATQALRSGAIDYVVKDADWNYLDILPISICKAHSNYKRNIDFRDTEKNYYEFLDDSSDLILSIGFDGRFIYCNRAFFSLLGFNKAELESLTILDIIHPEYRKKWARRVEEYRHGIFGSISDKTFVLVSKSGASIVAECTLSTKQNNLNETVAINVMFRIVGEGGQVKPIVNDSEEKYKLLVESAQDIIYSTDSHGKLNYINSRGVEVLEYEIDELISSDLYMLIDPDYVNDIQQFYKNQVQERNGSSYLEFPIVTKKNKRVWVGQKLKILFSDETNKEVSGYLGVVRDITEKRVMEQQLLLTNQVLEKRVTWRTRELEKINEKLRSEIELRTKTEAALKASESEYRALFQNAHDAIMIIDLKKSSVLGVNQQACKLYGYSEKEFLEKTLYDISENIEVKKFVDSLEVDSIYNAESSHKNKFGHRIFVDVNATKVIYKGQEAVLSINRDITIKREVQAELALERTRRLTALIDGQEMERKRLSREMHDGLGQLLTAAIIYLKQLKSTAESEKAESLADKTREIVEQTIDEVRTISHNLMPSILNDFGLEVALNNMVVSINRESKAHVKFFRRGNIKRLEPEVEIGLYRIAQEALNNAIKYSNAEQIRVSLTVDKNGAQKLSIKDNGVGIKSVLDSLEHHGNGIYNMKQRSAIIGCDFNIESARGKGTEVTVLLCETV